MDRRRGIRALLAIAAVVATATGCEAGRVTDVRDGDTIEMRGVPIRLIGIDTPERGTCGYDQATRRMAQLVAGRNVVAAPDAASGDVDRYGRRLRFVLIRDGRGRLVDVGRVMLAEGLAVARYDSRDGYGRHRNEDAYRALDAATPNLCPSATPAEPSTGAYYENCAAARAAGAAPLLAGQPGYRSGLDGDGDGIACE